MTTNHTPTPVIEAARALMERDSDLTIREALERAYRATVPALTARVAELEAALSFIRDEAYRGIGANQPEADAYFRTIEECARRRLARDRAALAKS